MGMTFATDVAVDSSHTLSVHGLKVYALVKVSLSSVSSLPKTYTVTGLTEDHEVIKSVLSVPEAQGSDWTITTDDDELTISGTFRGTDPTNITLYLAIPETLTATEVVSE